MRAQVGDFLSLVFRRLHVVAGIGALALLLAPRSLQAHTPTDPVDFIRHNIGGACRPDHDINNGSGCCGTPGNPHCFGEIGCIRSDIKDVQGPLFTVPLCMLPDPKCDDASEAISGSGDTFYVSSDLHFFRSGFKPSRQVAHPKAMNRLAEKKTSWTSFFDATFNITDVIAPPRAVIINGDFTLGAKPPELGAYRLLWERGNMPGHSINFPVFVGLGNHELTANVCGDGELHFGVCKDRTKALYDYVVARMGCAAGINMDFVPAPTGGMSSGSANYSWDFGNTHFVMLNNWANDQSSYFQQWRKLEWKNKDDGLAWLADDLASRVGKSERPVVVFQHLKLNGDDDPWNATERKKTLDILSRYNVVVFFEAHGHDRTSSTVVYRSEATGYRLFDTFRSGSGGAGFDPEKNKLGANVFIVARVKDDRYVDVGYVQLDDAGEPQAAVNAAIEEGGSLFQGGSRLCRKRINDNFIELPEASVEYVAGGSESVIIKRRSLSQIPGPVAVQLLTKADAAQMAKRSFVNVCVGSERRYAAKVGSVNVEKQVSSAGPPHASYYLLTAVELATLNGSGTVTVNPGLTKAPAEEDLKLVQLTRLRSVRIANGPEQMTDTVVIDRADDDVAKDSELVEVSLTGLQGGMSVERRYEANSGSKLPDWLQVEGRPSFDRFGNGVLRFRIDWKALAGNRGELLVADLEVTNTPVGVQIDHVTYGPNDVRGWPDEQNPYTLRVRAKVNVDRRISTPLVLQQITGADGQTQLKVTVVPSSLRKNAEQGGTVYPDKRVFLNRRVAGQDVPIAENRLNQNDGRGCGNNTVYFSGATCNGDWITDRRGAFNLVVGPGANEYFATYEGNNDYHSGTSNLISVEENVPVRAWVQVKGGVTPAERRFLSVPSDGSKADLHTMDDGSGRQHWLFLRRSNDDYSIAVRSPTDRGKFLNASRDGRKIDLAAADDPDSGLTRWRLVRQTDGTYTIANPIHAETRLLSVPNSGEVANLYHTDDGTGHQRWRIDPIPERLTIGAVARQSSTQDGAGSEAARVLDGDTSTINRTKNGTREWLEVDLRAAHEISQVVIHNRAESLGPSSWRNAKVELSTDPCDARARRTADETTIAALGAGSPLFYTPSNPVTARYVCIRQPQGTNELVQVAEVIVLGRRALDDLLTGAAPRQSGEWLETVLPQTTSVHEVAVYGRRGQSRPPEWKNARVEITGDACERAGRDILAQATIGQLGEDADPARFRLTYPVNARYVCLGQPRGVREFVAEVKVLGRLPLDNLITSATLARQSSTDRPASNVLDGNVSTYSHTNNDKGAWLEVDLRRRHDVHQVVLHNWREQARRWNDAFVELTEQRCDLADRVVAARTTIAELDGETLDAVTMDLPAPVRARYVCVRQPLHVARPLSLTEIMVRGRAGTESLPSVASNSPPQDPPQAEATASRGDLIEGELSLGDGWWGSWRLEQICPDPTYAMGFQLRVEGDQRNGDDTALNAVRLTCATKGPSRPTTIETNAGDWGNWGNEVRCPEGSFVVAGRMRIEGDQKQGDDTAANDLQLRCSNGTELSVNNGMRWGEWGPWRECSAGELVCGIQARVEPSQGGDKDDTALNGLRLRCCTTGQSTQTAQATPSGGTRWQKMSGSASDVGVGADGSVWIIGTDAKKGVFRLSGNDWTRVGDIGVRIAADPRGQPWVVNTANHVWVNEAGTWRQKSGTATDIAVGVDGSIWSVGTDKGVYAWKNNDWVRSGDNAVRIAVDSKGQPWVVNTANHIWVRESEVWRQKPGAALDVGAGADGSVWIIATNNKTYRWNGADWQLVEGTASHISVGPGGLPWVVTAAGEIYRRQ